MRDAPELLGLLLAGAAPPLAWLAVGLWALRAWHLEARGAERLALAYALGTGIASLALLGLRLADVPVPLAAVAAIALLGAPLWRTPGAGPAPAARHAHDTAPAAPRGSRAVDAAALAIAGLTFLAALGPETYWDGFEYHLPLAAAWSEGPIRSLPGRLDAELRAGVDLLYLPAVAAGHPDAAAAVSAGFALALAALVRGEARRRASPGAGALAGLFVLLVPFTRENAPSSYVDLAVGCYGFVALCLADRWSRTGNAAALWMAAACAAFAANAKLHAALVLPAVLAVAALGGRPPGARRLLGSGVLAAALMLPWFAKAWLTTGNPLFPLLAHRLGSGFADPAHLSLRRARLMTDFPGPRTPANLLAWLGSLAYGRNPHLSGQLGPLPFALLPAAIQRITRPTRVLVAVLVLFAVLQSTFMPALRFGTPWLPFLAVGAAVGGARLARASRGCAAVLGALFALLIVHHGAALLGEYLPRVVALRAPEAYAARVFPDQVALARLVARGEGVVGIPGGAVSWMPRPVYVLHWERNGEIFFDPVRGHYTLPDVALARLRERGVRSLVLETTRELWASGRTGHRTADAWLARDLATLRRDVAPLPARAGRIYVLLSLRDA